MNKFSKIFNYVKGSVSKPFDYVSAGIKKLKPFFDNIKGKISDKYRYTLIVFRRWRRRRKLRRL